MPEAVVNSSSTPEVTPLALLPVYLALIATIRRSCFSVPSSQTEVAEACSKLSDSVKKFREYLFLQGNRENGSGSSERKWGSQMLLQAVFDTLFGRISSDQK